jgi:hypothetical protein
MPAKAARKKKRAHPGFWRGIIEIVVHQVYIGTYVGCVLAIHGGFRAAAAWWHLEHESWVISFGNGIAFFATWPFYIFEAIEVIGSARRRWQRAWGKEDE